MADIFDQYQSNLGFSTDFHRIFCDLTKASDCMNREILLAKLHFYGIRGVSVDRFGPYLTNRRQKV